jgi:hypothetical protein
MESNCRMPIEALSGSEDAAWRLGALTGPGHPVVILIRLEAVVRVDLMLEVDPHGHAVLERFRDVLFWHIRRDVGDEERGRGLRADRP